MHYTFKTKYYFINKFDKNILNKQDKRTIIIFRDYNSRKINKMLIGIDSLEQLKIFIKAFTKKNNKRLINFNSKHKISVIDPRRWIKI